MSGKITIEEAERRNPGVTDDDRLARHPELAKPFGALNSEWERLKAEIKPGDELWTFTSPIESWSQLAGRAGLALVRGGCVIAAITTIMN